MNTTKVRICLGQNSIELEGTEEFVTSRLEEFKQLLTAGSTTETPAREQKQPTTPLVSRPAKANRSNRLLHYRGPRARGNTKGVGSLCFKQARLATEGNVE